MAKQRSSFAKLQRDKAKKEKAAEKRAKQLVRKGDEPAADVATEVVQRDVISMVSGKGEPSPQELLRLVEDLHSRREAGLISEDEFEEAKIELFARLQS